MAEPDGHARSSARTFAHVGVSSKGVLRGVGWLAAARLLGMMLSLVSTAVLARILSPSDFGLMILVAVIANLAAQVVEGGVAVPLVQRAQISTAHVHMALVLATLVALVLAAALTLIAQIGQMVAGREIVPATVVLFASLTMPFRAWISVLSAILQREGRFRENTIIALQSNLFGNVLPALILAWAGFQIQALLVGLLAASVLEAALTARAARIPRFQVPPLAAARDLATASYAGTTMQVINWAALSSPNFLVGTLFGAHALGLFSRGATLVNLAKDVLGSSLARVLLPTFAAMESEPARQAEAFERAMAASLPAFAVASTALVIHAEATVRIILGPAWGESIPVLQLLALGLLPRISYKVSDSLLMAKGELWLVASRQLFYLTAIVGLSLGASGLGINGVAGAVTAATALYYVVSLRAVSRRLGMAGSRILRMHAAAIVWAITVACVDVPLTLAASPLGFWPSQILGGAALTLASVILFLCTPERALGGDMAALRTRLRSRLAARLRTRPALSAG
ncbi:oligosaccharide flippase family protein [Methylobacterium sp. J-070]|uniref:oligosaccharide flippase family protein n=1 Tax=Methylobacterium sp. J-070 TaxID=2836650 RepID=UPI001FBB5AEF|nr:oligosaccharide flippase family protein [Methylobacterium sp. J-070]MCJ2053857.1 oligosaccharide flippase family protein [Methylobacterium sp. J-070]